MILKMEVTLTEGDVKDYMSAFSEGARKKILAYCAMTGCSVLEAFKTGIESAMGGSGETRLAANVIQFPVPA